MLWTVRCKRAVCNSGRYHCVHSEPFLVEDVSVQTFSLQEASTRICEDVSSGKAFSVFTLNLDHIVKLRRNGAFRAAYDRARIVLADGFPIVLSGRLQGRHVTRTTGADLIEPLCAEASSRDLPILLFGSTFETLTVAARALKARHRNLTIAGIYAPQHGLDHARAELAAWVTDCNTERPHSALGYTTPAAFAAGLGSATDRLAPPFQSTARWPVAGITKDAVSMTCFHETPSFEIRVFRLCSRLGRRTDGHEGLEVHGRAEGVHHPAG